MARKWVSALQIVTANGEVLELNQGLEKNNTGYDLIQLMVGSEGTLAVITEATLKLCKLPQKTLVLFFSLDSFSAIARLLETSRKGPFEILAFEFFSEKCLAAVEKNLNRKSKLKNPGAFYVLMEVESFLSKENDEKIEAWFEDLLKAQITKDAFWAQTSEEEKQVWGLREGITESLAKLSAVKKYDVAVSVKKMVDFLEKVQKLFYEKKYAVDLYLFGHFGDGSPHLNLLKQDFTEVSLFEQECARFEKDLFALLLEFKGSASAEHGVGLLKKNWVHYSKTPFELEVYKQIKTAWDPQSILNPGKIF